MRKNSKRLIVYLAIFLVALLVAVGSIAIKKTAEPKPIFKDKIYLAAALR